MRKPPIEANFLPRRKCHEDVGLQVEIGFTLRHDEQSQFRRWVDGAAGPEPRSRRDVARCRRTEMRFWRNKAKLHLAYSHSIVPGGLLLMS